MNDFYLLIFSSLKKSFKALVHICVRALKNKQPQSLLLFIYLFIFICFTCLQNNLALTSTPLNVVKLFYYFENLAKLQYIFCMMNFLFFFSFSCADTHMWTDALSLYRVDDENRSYNVACTGWNRFFCRLCIRAEF